MNYRSLVLFCLFAQSSCGGQVTAPDDPGQGGAGGGGGSSAPSTTGQGAAGGGAGSCTGCLEYANAVDDGPLCPGAEEALRVLYECGCASCPACHDAEVCGGASMAPPPGCSECFGKAPCQSELNACMAIE